MSRLHSPDKTSMDSPQIRKSVSTTFIQTPYQHLQYLISILTCPICHNQVNHAHMCPNCCKMICESCIKHWVISNKQQCPSCLKSLRYTTTINCQSLAKQIEQAIVKMTADLNSNSNNNSSISPASVSLARSQKPIQFAYSTPNLHFALSQIRTNEQLCKQHELKIDYYCEVCKISLCSDCAVLGPQHQGHKLCKFGHKKLKFKQKLNQLKKDLNAFRNYVCRLRDENSQMIDHLHRFELQKKQIFQTYMQRVGEAATSKLNKYIHKKQSTFSSLIQKINQLYNEYTTLTKMIQAQNKCSLIRKSISLQGEIKNIINNQLKPIKVQKFIFQNQISPTFGSKTFILDNYNYLRQKKQILYSDPLYWKGIQWRLKIYPEKNLELGEISKEEQKFLAIYLQMSKGHRYPNFYKYEILLINQLDRSKAIGCTFQNEFEQGTYWGLDQFANIQFLCDQNFIHPTHNCLQIVLNVKQSSYYHAVKDQNFLIMEKQFINIQQNKRLKYLKKILKFKGVQINEQSKKSQNIRALIDNQNQKSMRRLTEIKRSKSLNNF